MPRACRGRARWPGVPPVMRARRVPAGVGDGVAPAAHGLLALGTVAAGDRAPGLASVRAVPGKGGAAVATDDPREVTGAGGTGAPGPTAGRAAGGDSAALPGGEGRTAVLTDSGTTVHF